jgi:hypothetical protein
MKQLIIFQILVVALLISCSDDKITSPKPDKFNYNFTFEIGNEGWIGDFADYPNSDNVEQFYEFIYEHSKLPKPLSQDIYALKQSGNNHSDDLFMFVKRKIDGLEPNTNYSISFDFQIASNAPNESVGVGGSPGTSVFIKAGASTIEPKKVLDDSNYYIMNIDKSNQKNSGEDMILIGDFANGSNKNEYALKSFDCPNLISVDSDAHGRLWLIIGTDSGFEATTTIYYNFINIELDKNEVVKQSN